MTYNELPLHDVREVVLNLEELRVRPVQRGEERRYQELMQAHHYLGSLPKIGETLWYVTSWGEEWVALLSFSAAAWKCTVRDRWHLSKATYPDATYEAYTYDSAGRMLTVRDRRGNTMVTNEYDANGRVSRQTLADGAIFNFAYTLDANAKVTQTDVTDPRGNVRRRQFNGAGYITSLTRALGTPLEQTVTYTRNAANFVTEMTDALGRVTHYQYDAKGNRTQVTRLYGTPEAVSWNTT